MSANSSHRVLHRMVPLICQALTTSPSDDLVWLEGLRLLSNPKLRTSMSLTSSIWLPLLLKSLEVHRSKEVICAGLKLLAGVAETLEPMKSCLVKPLRALGKDAEIGVSEELTVAVSLLGLTILNKDNREVGRPKSTVIESGPNTAMPPVTPVPAQPPNPRDHPLIEEMLAHSLPARSRSVQLAWTHTLLSATYENASVWLQQLYQATLEASAVPEIVVTAKLGPLINAEMFHTSFLKCYRQIKDEKPFKDSVDQCLMQIFKSRLISPEIHCALMDLVAFFDKGTKEFPLAVFDAAKRCALENFEGDLSQPLPAICLWYTEQCTEEEMTAANIANLVEANIRIGSSGYDSAWSSLLWLRDSYEVQPRPIWTTQLSHWQKALDQQDEIDGEGDVTTFESFNTRLICYHALGQFERGYKLAQSLFEGLSDQDRRKTAHWATAASWHMGDYDAMADFLAFHPKGTSKSLYKAIIDVHHGQYASAFHHIRKAQSLSYDELQTQLEHGPQVAQKSLAKTELLVELAEVIQYKSQPDVREHLQNVWRTRFKKSHADANTWLKRLQIWTLACPPSTLGLQRCYLDASKLCESAGMHDAAHKLLEWTNPGEHPPGCKVEYTQLRFNWKDATQRQDTQKMTEVIAQMHVHTTSFLHSIGIDRMALESEGLGIRPLITVENVAQRDRNILARRFYRLAQWTELVQGSFWLTDAESEVYRYYSLAYKLDDLWYNGAYSLAQASMNIFEANSYPKSDLIAVNNYVVPTVRGLFQAVRSRETPEKMIKALLRLVTIWFRYGENESVLVEVERQLAETSISSWLMAIPQLIARLGTPHQELQGLLIELLRNIARQFPHAVIWPLLTASQTRKQEHEKAARMIMNYICQMQDGTRLVLQAELVGRELIRTSISWLEKWRNLIDRCLPRQDLMEIAWHDVPQQWEEEIGHLSDPETPDEEHFAHHFGSRLKVIFKTLIKYRSTRQLSLINTVYTDLYKLYGEFDAQLDQWRQPGAKIQLASAAPRLLALRECILTVPGQYDPNIPLDDQAFIDAFVPTVDVVSSKMLPRKLVIMSPKKGYTFLLKGNEDLRGDERVMQLFTLINTLLNHNSEAFGRNLHLLPYEVIPLSPSAGLLTWVTNTQQLRALIASNRDRQKSNNLTDRELASLLGYDPDNFDTKHDRPRIDPPAESDRYDKLPLATKVERLSAAMSHSRQSDLKDVLWRRSPSAEIWIRRRTNFARTIGVGSFVGYTIGLGDRHGSNILIDQSTWGALHIDFGDLFDIARERSYLPEKVPYRLTKMMTNAMELATSAGHKTPGSRGSFKQASIIAMGVLRESRSTLLAMLEAFLYDPLLSWTVNNATPSDSAAQSQGQASGTTVNQPKPKKHGTVFIPQSVAPMKDKQEGDSDVYNRIENSLIATYLETDSYMARISTGMTNSKALHVLASIERKLAGVYISTDQPLPVKKQVQELIEQATDPRNLAQGYVLGWIPHW